MKSFRKFIMLCVFAICGGVANFCLAAAANPKLEADKVCTACHNESWRTPVLAIYQTRHGNKADARTPGCRTCHGQSDKHLESPANSPDVVFAAKSKRRSAADTANTVCLGCHARDEKRLHWQGSPHQLRDVTCATCHEVHAASQRVLNKSAQSEVCFNCHKEQRSQILRISTHPIAAGKVSCSDCHNPHGSTSRSQLAKNTVNETCYACHAEKRGPFLWEHPPASDDCTICHTPHGSTSEPLLKGRMPWLCQNCHGDGAPHPGNIYSGASLPGGAVANINQTGGTTGTTLLGAINPLTGAKTTANNPPAQLAFRGCANCHTQVHGSNNPTGNRFLR